MIEASSTRDEGRTETAGGPLDERAWPLWAAGAAILGALLALAAWDPGQGTPVFFLLFGLASAGYLLAMLQLASRRHPSPRALAALAVLAFAWRIPLVFAPMHPGADVAR